MKNLSQNGAKVYRSWIKQYDQLTERIIAKAKKEGNARFLKTVATRLRNIASEIDALVADLPEVHEQTRAVERVLDALLPVFKENPDMPIREIARLTGCSQTTIVKYRRYYRKKYGLPVIKPGPRAKSSPPAEYVSDEAELYRAKAGIFIYSKIVP